MVRVAIISSIRRLSSPQSRFAPKGRCFAPPLVASARGVSLRLCRGRVNPLRGKYSTLPKFGNGVCVAHPGSSLRGDLVVVTFASRACGGRGSVRVRGLGQGGLLSVSPRLRSDERRC